MAFKNFQKHFNAITKTASDARPVLQNWLLTPDYWYVIDGMRAIRVPNTIPVSKDAVVDPETMTSVDNNVETGMSYPALHSLFADLLTTNEPTITIAPSKLDLRMLSALKSEKTVLLVPNGNELRVTDIHQKSVATSFDLTSPVACTDPIYVNPKYLLDAINALSDSEDNEFKVRIASQIQPVQFENKDISYLLTPVHPPRA